MTVLDCGIITVADSRYIDVTPVINGHSVGSIIAIPRPVVAGHPLFLPIRIIFDCRIIVIAINESCSLTASGDINVA